MYRAGHYEKGGWNLSLNIPGEVGMLTSGRFSAKRQVNFTEFGFSSVSEISEVESVIRIVVSASKSVSYCTA